mmetsp:Transcript_15024/g.42733  ORF Transcript_15024/g.42733 Transcript_15024/m.42733 type:complete len:238 (-) Transcript_15024:90-803(-)
MAMARAPLLVTLAALASLRSALAVRQSQAIAEGARRGVLSVAEASGTPQLMSDGDADADKLAADLSAQVRAQGAVHIVIVGPDGAFAAMKAVSAVAQAMSSELALKGMVLAAFPSRHTHTIESGKKINTVIVEVRPQQASLVPQVVDVTVAAGTKVGSLGSYLAKVFQDSGGAVLAAIGPVAVMKALNSAAFASRFLANDLKVNEAKLACSPAFSEVAGEQGGIVERMALTCAPAPN